MKSTCAHLDQIERAKPCSDGCEECLRMGDEWVHLRLCLICGHVGCCDDSTNKHATAHFHSTQHPVIESLDENWRWCYVDKVLFAADAPGANRSLRKMPDMVTKDRFRSNKALPPAGNAANGNGYKRGFNSICQRVRKCNKKNLGAKHITDPNLRGTIKELAQLDGAFVISDDGVVVSACRYLDAVASDVVLPFGMASRHLAGASISQITDAVAIVV